MKQAISGDVRAVITEIKASGLLTSLCTIKTPAEAFGPTGAIDTSATWQPLAGHIDLPCTAPPMMSQDKVGENETKLRDGTEQYTYLHVLLDGYYPLIRMDYRAAVDGVDYDIVGTESDSQRTMTRLAVRRVNL